jgi:hypothetical protein
MSERNADAMDIWNKVSPHIATNPYCSDVTVDQRSYNFSRYDRIDRGAALLRTIDPEDAILPCKQN